jgi:hypothetical protein
MKKTLTALSLAAMALVPATALAQTTCEQQRSTRVVATVGGAGVGALLGSSVAGRGDRTLGAIIGGIGGALAGNAISGGGGKLGGTLIGAGVGAYAGHKIGQNSHNC